MLLLKDTCLLVVDPQHPHPLLQPKILSQQRRPSCRRALLPPTPFQAALVLKAD